MKKSFIFVMVGFVLSVFMPVLSAGAMEIPIDNPGFENPVLADGDWAYSLDNEGWGYFDNDGYLGAWNVQNADYVGEAPEGENVGWAEPALGVPGGFAQVLLDKEAVLKPGSYTLTVLVGAARTYSSGGYKVQLLAGGTPHTPGTGAYTGPVTGGTLLAEDDNTLHPIKAGTFETSTVKYTYNAALHSHLLGEPLQIRLLALPGGDETEFEDVKLSWEGSTASNPNPPDNAVDVPVETNLSWDRGKYCIQDEVYFGTDPVMGNLPKVATLSAASQDPEWDPPGDLIASTTYYWYVVETDSNKPHTPDASWSFATVRGECQPDYPYDGSIIGGYNYPSTPPYTHIYTTLDFIPGPTAVKHTGYFSDDYAKVAGRVEDANLGLPASPNRYYAGMPLVEPATDTLVRGTKYYWTVDATDALGNIFSGDIWEFTINDYYAYAPSPPNEAVLIPNDVLLSWKPGYGVAEHDVYIGTTWEDVNDANYTDPSTLVNVTLVTRSEPNYQTSSLAFGTKFYWRVDEVNGRFPPASPGTYYKGDVWCFTTVPEDVGTIREDLWWNIPGNPIENLYNDPRFPANPDETRSLTLFDSGTALGNEYGGMIHGWLHVAKSGDYTFWIAADDQCDLFLSTDDQPANMSRIANAPGWLNPYEWKWYFEQKSAPIPLLAGRKYYIRACWKEGSGGDHCEVAWQGPEQPIPPANFSPDPVIPGSRLSPFVQKWAHTPDPAHNQNGVASPVMLGWGLGDHALKHDVYFSTDKALVDTRDVSAFMGRIDPNTYGPLVLETGRLYYWAVDEVNDLGPEPGLWSGATWVFRAAGAAGGLQGLYYHWDGIFPPPVPSGPPDPGPMNPFQVFVLSRIDPTINFNWGSGATPGINSPDPLINVDYFAIKWVGHVECPVDANYTFYTTTDDGARLFINGVQILPTAAWQQQGMTEWSGSVVLSAGLHDIEMHYEEGNGGAGAQLRWSAIPTNPADDAIPKQIIPAIYLWPSLFAIGPNPPHLATINNRKPALEWIPGLYAVTHEVYFSDKFNDVNDRNTAVKQIVTDPCVPYPALAAPLQLGRTYYWCVDEVKSVAERWDARSVWEFTISECISIDDFEDYNDRGELRLVWTDGYANVIWGGTYPHHYVIQGGSSGSNLNLSSAVGTPVGGTTGPVLPAPLNYDAMVLRYDNDGETYTGLPGAEGWKYDAPYFSEIEADTTGPNSLDVGLDWSGEGIKSLSLWFQGHPLSDGDYDSTNWPLYTVSGRGRDIEGRHDEFYFLSVYPLTGSGTIQVKITGMDNTDPWAKAGLMIRDKWAPYSKFAAVYMTPGNGVTFQWRANEDGPVDYRVKPGVTVPQYLKLERTFSGNFIAKHSGTAAIVWEDVNSTTAPEQPLILMGVDDPNIYIGTAVTSHDALETCTAGFDTVQVIATPAPTTWIAGNIGTNDANQLYVALSDSTKTVVVNHPDPCAATLTDWQEWNIELTDFVGLDLSDVQKVHIGVGNRVTHPEPGGSGALYIDDFRACPPRCVAAYGKPLGDIAQPYDCVVDEKDLSVMAGDWLIEVTDPGTGNLVGWWKLDDATGTTAQDSSIHGNHGTLIGMDPASDWVMGRIGGALHFDGIDDYVDCGNGASLQITGTAISLTAWVKYDTAADYSGIAMKTTSGNWDDGYGLYADSDAVNFYVVDYSNRATKSFVADDQWHHVVGTYDGSNVRVWVDGVEGTSFSYTSSITNTVNSLQIGRGADDDYNFSGALDDVRLYNVALAYTDVLGLFGSLSGLGTDLYDDMRINFKDYSLLAGSWLEEQLWP